MGRRGLLLLIVRLLLKGLLLELLLLLEFCFGDFLVLGVELFLHFRDRVRQLFNCGAEVVLQSRVIGGRVNTVLSLCILSYPQPSISRGIHASKNKWDTTISTTGEAV